MKMHRKTTAIMTLTFCMGLLLSGCTAQTPREEGEQQNQETASAMSSSADSLNTLTASERQAGWQLLFSGGDLSEWRGFKQQGIPQGWTAQNGAIHFNGEGNSDLITKQQYDNFELKVDWKIAEGGNSGIFYNVSEEYDGVPASAPEYQLIDAENYEGDLKDEQTSGANYALHAPTKGVAYPAGRWNETRIVVNGNHVEHWLNGEKVVEYELESEDWKKRVANSKFADWKGYAQSERGHLALQNHGDSVWFRNIKVRPLNQEQSS